MSPQHSPATVTRRTVLGAGAAAAGLGLTGLSIPFGSRPAFAAEGKTGSTYYTADKVANARANIAKYSWAAELRDTAVAAAERYVNRTDDELWSLVPAQTIGRSLGVLIRYQARILGAPGAAQGGVGDGAAINAFGNYPWIIDQFEHPWKIKNPANGELYPSNDFASYYAAGLDEHGEFDPALARQRGSQYLVNELYPERGEGWGVDDGSGWTDDDGNIWTFIAYYCHWGLWYRTGSTTYGLLQHALQVLRDAYLYTGEERYAHKGMVLLDRIADVYPAMDVTAFRWQAGFDNGDPAVHTAQGKTVNDIWETGVANSLIQAYDAFWPAIETDSALLSFVQDKASTYGISTPKATAADLRRHIEDHVLRLVLPAVKNSQIRGNTGMHHATLALAAVVLDSAGESNEILDFCFQPGALVQVKDASAPYGRRYEVTGGDLARLLVDAVDRDGNGNESAPGYNTLWLNSLLPMADAVAGYQRYPDYDLFGNVKFRSMFTAVAPIMMLGRYTPSIGDSGNAGGPGLVSNLTTSTVGFTATGDPMLAQLIDLLAKGDLSAVHGSVFDADPEAIRDQVQAVVAEQGPLNPATTHLTGYGFSGLRQGAGSDARAIWTYYGRSSGHGHLDCLNLGVHGAGMDLAPDLGYPEVTGSDPERLNWTAATVSHNTVVVDEASQQPQWVATPLLLGTGEQVSLAEIESAKAYPTLDRYRRTTALVKVDEASSYAVDLFRVSGGKSHVFSFHGGPGPVTTSGLTLAEQTSGSYAGPEVPFRDPSYNTAKRCGFNYLDKVERDTTPAPSWSVDWAIGDQWDVHPVDPDAHLRLTMLNQVGDVALADGVPPRNKPGNPASLRYLLARRSTAGPDGEPLPANQLANGGFEDLTGGFPTGWTQFNPANPATLVTDPVHGGTHAIRLADPDTTLSSGLRSASVDATPGQLLEASAWMLVTAGSPELYLEFWNATGTRIRVVTAKAATSGDWQLVRLQGTAPAGTVRATVLVYSSSVNIGTVVVDDAGLGVVTAGGPGLSSTFTSVIEPYVGSRVVRSSRLAAISGSPAPEVATAVRIELADDRIDYLISSADPEQEFVIDGVVRFRGRFGWLRLSGDRVAHRYSLGTTKLQLVDEDRPTMVAELTGTVDSFTQDLALENAMVINHDPVPGQFARTVSRLVGSWIHVANDGVRNACYRIESATVTGRNQLRLGLGGQTLVRELADPDDANGGYTYDVAAGARFTIPLAHVG